MIGNDLSREELLNTFQRLAKTYNEALTQNAELENLKGLYVELRELKWKILEFGYVHDYRSISISLN